MNSRLKVGRLKRATVNSEGFRETLSEERQRGPKEAKMAGKEEATRRVGGPHDLRSEIGGRKAKTHLETTGDLAPVYRGEGEQGREGLSRSERDVEFVNETMRTAQVQNIITRIEMVVQDLIQTASGDDAQRLKRSMRAFKSALAWGMGLLDHIGQHCKWPPHSEERGGQSRGRDNEGAAGVRSEEKDADVTHLVGSRMQCPCCLGQGAH